MTIKEFICNSIDDKYKPGTSVNEVLIGRGREICTKLRDEIIAAVASSRIEVEETIKAYGFDIC